MGNIYSERQILDLWKENDIISQLKQKNKNSERCIIFESPVSTNSLDMDALRLQINKDIFLKYKSMTGSEVCCIAMWDIYSSAIERKASKELEAEKRKYDVIRLRRRCRKYLEDDFEFQNELLDNLGIFCDWYNTKKILSPRYDARIITAFGTLIGKSYLHKDLKPSYWCIKCQTILLDKDDMSDKTYQVYSGYVKFPVSIGLEEYGENVFMLVWVDTLWMLAASVAIVIREDGTYSIVKSGNEFLILEKGNEEKLFNLDEIKILNYISHSELAKCKCSHPFLEYDLPVVSSKYVKDRVGIGLFNVAPGHNPLDYELALKHRFKTFSVVDAEGQLTNNAEKFCGLEFIEAGKFIAFELEQNNYILKKSSGGSSYPHCNLCGTPAIFRPVSQWLLPSENNDLYFNTLKKIEKIDWKCEPSIKDEVKDIIENVKDWYISSQREWGMPIPIILCNKCGQIITNREVVKSVRDAIYRRSPDSWFRLGTEDLLPSDTKCPDCGSQEFVKEHGVLERDFFSVISTLTRMPAKSRFTSSVGVFWGNKQNYGRYLSLFFLISSALKKCIPFEQVYPCLFDTFPQSKLFWDTLFSQNNREKYSPDFLRLCITILVDRLKANKDKDDLQTDSSSLDSFKIKKHIDILKEEYRLITKRFYLIVGNISDYDKKAVENISLIDFDQIALSRFNMLIKELVDFYENCEFIKVWDQIFKYINTDLAFYFDAVKERLYFSGKDSLDRVSAQTVLYQITDSLIKLIAPIVPFLAEKIWQVFNFEKIDKDEFDSVFLTPFPEIKQKDSSILNKWAKLIALKERIVDEIDSALSKGIIDSKRKAIIKIPKTLSIGISSYLKDLEFACSVAEIIIDESEQFSISCIDGRQCERCGRYYKVDFEEYNTTDSNYNPNKLCERCNACFDTLIQF